MGFVLNKYDPCVANAKMINGKQFTIRWWDDDNAMMHVDMEVMNEIIPGIEDKFGKLTITCDDQHTLLGMDLWFPGDRNIHCNGVRHDRVCLYVTVAYVCMSLQDRVCKYVRVNVMCV